MCNRSTAEETAIKIDRGLHGPFLSVEEQEYPHSLHQQIQNHRKAVA
jgi:hypothetical protein